jgi:hypothetical protein
MILILLFQLATLVTPGTDAVILEESRHFVYQDAGRGRLTHKEKVMILNREGRDYARYVLHYNTFVSVKNVSSTLMSADGTVIRRLRPREINDQSASDGVALIGDSRMKYFDMTHDTYPYIVETEYQFDFNGMLGLPTWAPMRSRAAIQSSSYTIDIPSTVPLGFADRNLSIEPEIQSVGNRTLYTWTVSDMSIPRRESQGLDWVEVAPLLVVSARDFRISGTQGSLESWSSLGLWIHNLWKGRDALPTSEVEKVKAMIADAPTKLEKIRRIYAYLQANTRYVGIQLGIGGWQTEEARSTSSTKYGDCKALTNYMMAMLRAVGIEAYPALINLGTNIDVIPDIPNNRFNHVVLFVPVDGDSLYLECTSKTYPMGYLGLANSGKHSLIITPEGGRLVKVPTRRSQQNQQIRTGTVTLDANGNARAAFQTVYTGYQHEYYREMDANMTPRDKDQMVRQNIRIPRFDLNSFAIEASADTAGAQLILSLTLPGYANRAGTRLIFQPNVMEQRRFTVSEQAERSQPVRFDFAYFDTDQIEFAIPPRYSIESIPSPVDIETSFGTYRSRYEVLDGKVVYRRELEIREVTIPADSFSDYRQFVNTMVQADQSRVVLTLN